ncbi:MAG: hypothetical protein RIE32_01700 [Phycisphaerales bacterium]
MQKQRPIKEYRLGNIKAAVWSHADEDRTRTTLRFTRLYYKDGVWHSSGMFDVRDLPTLAELANEVRRELAPVKVSISETAN